MLNPHQTFRVVRSLGTAQILIVDITCFHTQPCPGAESASWVCEYVNDDDEPVTVTIQNDARSGIQADFAFLHHDDAHRILTAFLRGTVPAPDWNRDEVVICVVDDLEFVIVADDPAHIVSWVRTEAETTTLSRVYESVKESREITQKQYEAFKRRKNPS